MSDNTNDDQIEKTKKLFPLILFLGLVALIYLIITVYQHIYLDVKNDWLSKFNVFNAYTDLINKPRIEESQILTKYSFVASEAGQTPFSLLVSNEQVEYDQYDFGVFVKAINHQASNSDYYWALYINNEYAQQASDQIVLAIGDQVEWRWEQIKEELAINTFLELFF